LADKNKNYVEYAKSLYQREKEAWSRIYEAVQQDARFLSDETGAQWNGRDYQERERTGRPALTLDKLGQFTRQVVNQIRMNTPTINVIPAKDGDEETAEVFKGLIKNIEYKSGADDAYDTAALYSVRTGLGWLRVDHDYIDDESFEQELKICRVVNNTAIYLDSQSIEIDGSDAKHAFVIDKMTVKEFREKYPDFSPCSFDDEKVKELKDADYISIAEFFEIEEEYKEFGLYEDGSRLEIKEGMPEPKAKRKVARKRVRRTKMSGSDILEETEFPGKYIPIIPVYGEEFWVEGKRQIYSLIRRAKQAQQLHNWWKSKEAEILMRQTEAPFMAAEGQIEEWAEDWKNPSKSAVLRYKTADALGNPIPPPQRLDPPQTPAGVFNAALASVDDIKAAIGMYNASLGQSSNETSGIAIQRRKQEGEIGTFHFADNLNKSITHAGRVLVCAIPEIYDTSRVERIIGDEDDVKEVGLNGAMVEGQKEEYDLKKGKYDVRVVTGNSFTTMRQEAAEFFTQVINQRPDLMQVIGDLAFKYMDIPGAQAISERIKKTIPPQLLEESDKQDPRVAQMQQVIEQGQAAIAEMQAQMQQMAQQLQDKQAEIQIKAQSEANKLEIERMNIQLEQQRVAFEQQKAVFEAQIKQQELAIEQEKLNLEKLKVLGQAEADVIAAGQSVANYGAEI